MAEPHGGEQSPIDQELAGFARERSARSAVTYDARTAGSRVAAAASTEELTPSSSVKAATMPGSNCVPAQRRSSSSAASSERFGWYMRSDVIASNASVTKMMRAPSGIASDRKSVV